MSDSKYTKGILVLEKYESLFKGKGKKNQSSRHTKILKKDIIDTQKALAKKVNMSHDTIHRVKYIRDNGTIEQKRLLVEDKISINRVYFDITHDIITKIGDNEYKFQNEFVKTLNVIYKKNVNCTYGIIDILTKDEIYELKFNPSSHEILMAIGQLISYQKAFKRIRNLIFVSNINIPLKYKKLFKMLNIKIIESRNI